MIKKFLSFTWVIFLLDFIGILLISLGVLHDLSGEVDGLGKVQILLILLGMILSLISSLGFEYRRHESKTYLLKTPTYVTFVIGITLLGINVFGLFIPLRNPDVFDGFPYAGLERKVQYSASEVFSEMNRIEAIDEQYPDYVKRLNQLIFDGTIHYWDYEQDNAHNLRIPIHENFLIFAQTLLSNDKNNYEFCNAKRAITRAASVCSQASKILADILGKNKVNADIVGLEGHVVVRALVDGHKREWWILDADYGVVIEHDLEEIENDPEIIRDYYEEKGYSQEVVDNLVNIYGADGNAIIETNLNCDEEDHLYVLKWLIPFTFVLPFALFAVTRLVIIKNRK